MPLDEYLFGRLVTYLKRKKQAAESQACRVDLDDVKQRLTILARAISGDAIEIFPAEREGGYKQHNFFLPVSCSFFPTIEDNLAFYFYRVIFLHIQRQLGLNGPTRTDLTLAEAQQQAMDAALVILVELEHHFPPVARIHEQCKAILEQSASEKAPVDLTWLYGKWMRDDPLDQSGTILQNTSDEINKASHKQPTTLIRSRAVEEIRSLIVDKKQQEDYILTHNFEKVETADEFSGVWRDFDGDDQLEDHQEAVDELNMKFTVRVDDQAHSVYQAEFIENTTISESAERDFHGYHLKYDEWDYRKRLYKPDFCKVYPRTQIKTDTDYYSRTIRDHARVLTNLRKMLANLNNTMQQQRRQSQGDEFDIDAITDMIADLHARHTPSENIYIANQKRAKDISIILLLDISLSSDGYAAGNRVIDVEKQMSILFGEILNEFEIDFSICSFFSKTRNYSTFLTLKEFDEPWHSARMKVGAVEPQGYTRIGAALRHAGAEMDLRPTKNKWIILMSDGKPNDFDKYEGKYGIQDVQQALRELYERQINSYALAVEAQAKYYLPQMFGQNHYQILTTPMELIQSMVKLYEKIRYKS